MLTEYPTDPKKLREYNYQKYRGVPPSWELIEKVIQKSGLKKLARFEYVWFMCRDTLTWYKNGKKILPAKYWHIFYDFDNVSKITATVRSKMRSRNIFVLKENKILLSEYQ